MKKTLGSFNKIGKGQEILEKTKIKKYQLFLILRLRLLFIILKRNLKIIYARGENEKYIFSDS